MNPIIRMWFLLAMMCICISACKSKRLIPVANYWWEKSPDNVMIKHDKTQKILHKDGTIVTLVGVGYAPFLGRPVSGIHPNGGVSSDLYDIS